MTVNVEAIIRSIGKTYQEVFDAGLIPYKSKPTGYSGDPDISLDMVKEGVHLTFKRDGRILWSVILSVQNNDVKNWVFPNELPVPLQKSMSRQWIHETFGPPCRSSPPEMIMKQTIGWTDLFTLDHFHIPMSMQVNYDLTDMVISIMFLPTSELRW